MALIGKYSLNWNANDWLWVNNWTATNINWVDWKLNQAGSFNGSSSTIAIWNNYWSITTSFTCSCIINTNTLSWVRRFISKWNDWWSPWWWFMIRQDNADVSVYVVTMSPIPALYRSPTFTISAFTDYHIVWYFDNNTQRVWLYVNWAFVWDTATGTVLRTKANNGSNIWSSFNWSIQEVFNWKIDEVELYDHALTPAEVKQRYSYLFWYL